MVAFDISTPSDPVLINTEPTQQWAMHVTASEGLAYVADWGYLAVYEADDAVKSPDVALGSDRVFLAPGEALTLSVANLGAGDLSLVGAAVSGAALTVEATADTLTSGERGQLRLTAPADDFDEATVCIASNDPDNPVQEITVVGGQTENGVGSAAPDFTLTDLDGVSHTLSDQRGKPVVLVYFATW